MSTNGRSKTMVPAIHSGGSSPFPKVYLAGKIAKNDWRHSLFDIGGDGFNRDGEPILTGIDTPRDGFICSGPFFIDCDHGCYHHAGAHGVGLEYGGCHSGSNEFRLTRESVTRLCRKWIDESDVVFCYLDSDRAFGTIFELGYAVAKGKPVFVAVRCALESGLEMGGFKFMPFWKDAWFLLHCADRAVGVPDAMAGWNAFVIWYRETRRMLADAESPF